MDWTVDVELRPLGKQDLEQVINIQERITRGKASQRWREMLSAHVGNRDNPGLVAVDGKNVLGFVIGEIKVGAFGSDVSGWLEMVGVAPEKMGDGVGKELAQELFRLFKERGVTHVFASVRWDSGDMLAFFQSLGFDRSPFINLVLSMEPGK